MSTFLTGVPNPNTRPPKRPSIKIPAFVDNLPSTDFHPILGEGITIAGVLGNKPPMRKPNKGTKFIIGATIEK